MIIAHGGAGGLTFEDRRRKGLARAATTGYRVLDQGGSSLDAVEEAVKVLEDCVIFNAGTGAVLGLTGTIEMDAAVMGMDGSFGAVAAIRNVKNPISVARLVMEQTDHLLLAGEGATLFARRMGVPFHNPRTPERRHEWHLARRSLQSRYFPRLKKLAATYGTVGVVALDRQGFVSAGTSTGGIRLHLPGRIGDTPLPGAGMYVDRHGGVSATGHGEAIMRILLAFRAVSMMARDAAPVAGKKALSFASRMNCRCGLVGIDRHGRIVHAHNTAGMSWAWVKNGELKTF